MMVRDSITRTRARTAGAEELLNLRGGARPDTVRDYRCASKCTKGGHKLHINRGMPGAGLSRSMRGKVLPYMPAFQPYRGNPPCGMIGRVEETSASFEARSAPRLYPTERLGVQFPGPTRQKRRIDAPDDFAACPLCP